MYAVECANMGRKAIILDLDETLITSCEWYPLYGDNYSFVMTPVDSPLVYVYMRPGLATFLDFCFENFSVAVWSHGSSQWVHQTLRRIMTTEQYLSLDFVYNRDHKVVRNRGVWYKDLRKVWSQRLLRRKGYLPESTIVVDDLPVNHHYNMENLYHISDYGGEPDDIDLLILLSRLITIMEADDVRTALADIKSKV